MQSTPDKDVATFLSQQNDIISVLSGHSHSRSGKFTADRFKKKNSSHVGGHMPLGGNFYKTPVSNMENTGRNWDMVNMLNSPKSLDGEPV